MFRRFRASVSAAPLKFKLVGAHRSSASPAFPRFCERGPIEVGRGAAAECRRRRRFRASVSAAPLKLLNASVAQIRVAPFPRFCERGPIEVLPQNLRASLDSFRASVSAAPLK